MARGGELILILIMPLRQLLRQLMFLLVIQRQLQLIFPILLQILRQSLPQIVFLLSLQRLASAPDHAGVLPQAFRLNSGASSVSLRVLGPCASPICCCFRLRFGEQRQGVHPLVSEPQLISKRTPVSRTPRSTISPFACPISGRIV